ncbi:MAG: hypothetical protein PHF63_12670 [Herbinix sp.]|nr:hypothetical protein [Herbinix sp.]
MIKKARYVIHQAFRNAETNHANRQKAFFPVGGTSGAVALGAAITGAEPVAAGAGIMGYTPAAGVPSWNFTYSLF